VPSAFGAGRLGDVETPSPTQIEGYRMAMLDLSRVSKAAIDAGVAERQVRLAERTAELLALAAEEALAAIQLNAERRAEFVRVFAESLRRLEDQPPAGLHVGTVG
jgi:hypothetical protein